MIRMLLLAGTLASCAPPTQETAMPRPGPVTASTEGLPPGRVATVPPDGGRGPERAAQGPVPAPVSAAENPAPRTDTSAEARGRRTLSTAFVMVGPDGRLTVELQDGRVLLLRDVVMGPKDYCGVRLGGGAADVRYCGRYDEVAAARPGAPLSR